MEKFGHSAVSNSQTKLAALFTAGAMLTSSVYAQESTPPAPGASGAADPSMSKPPPAPEQDGADAQCRGELEQCKNISKAISDDLTRCTTELAKCQKAKQAPSTTPASTGSKRTMTRTLERRGKITDRETIETTSDTDPALLKIFEELLRQRQQPAAVALPMQTTSVVVNIQNNPRMDNSNSVNSYNDKGTQSTQQAQQSSDNPAPVSSSGLDLYGRMGAGGDYTFDKRGTESFLIEGQAMARSGGIFGFGARAGVQMTPKRESWIGSHKGTVPTNSVFVEGCAEKAPSNEVGPGFMAGACAGVQQEVANDIIDDTDESIRLSGWKQKYPRASLYLGGTFKFTDRIGAYILGRIAAVLGHRDSVRDDSHQEHTVPEVGVTAGVTFD